jgi:DNA-binding response OmpR family regulator
VYRRLRSGVTAKVRPLVLLVEEEHADRATYADYLARSGFRVVEAIGGSDAIDLALEHRPAAVVITLSLPGVDGLRVVRRLRADTRTAHAPIVALSGWGQTMLESVARAAGCDVFLEKPCPASRVLGELIRIMARRSDAADQK